MTIAHGDLLALVVRPTLKVLNQEDARAEQLLIAATQAFELGERLTPCEGPGLGVFGITSQQHRCLWDTYLIHNHDLASKVRGLASQREFLAHPDEELITNLRYATAVAWLLIRQYLESKNLSLEHTSQVELITAIFSKHSHHLAA